MQNLVTINNNQTVVSSRSLADNFGKRHDHVLRDIDRIQKDAPNFGEMFYESTMPDSYSREQKIYLMNRDGFTLLAMGFTGAKALEWKLKYIQAFNAMEKQVFQLFALPKDFPEALRMLAAEVEQKIALTEKVAELEPKAMAYDNFINGEGFYNMNSVAKILDTGRNHMMQKLRELKILMHNNVPYQKYMNKGLFIVKASVQNNRSTETTLVSAKGVDYISKTVAGVSKCQS